MDNAQLINQTSGKTEWYTPAHPEVSIARATMGWIDLDPASCEIANRTVRAARFWTKHDDALSRDWIAETLWLNWPFSLRNNKIWPAYAIDQYERGHFEQGCIISYASTSETWFRVFDPYPMAWIHGRTHFIDPDNPEKKNAPKGCVIIYLGPNIESFYRAASPHARVDVPLTTELVRSLTTQEGVMYASTTTTPGGRSKVGRRWTGSGDRDGLPRGRKDSHVADVAGRALPHQPD